VPHPQLYSWTQVTGITEIYKKKGLTMEEIRAEIIIIIILIVQKLQCKPFLGTIT
jgi:hypothetical protein